MITGEMRNRIDTLWKPFRVGGIANPIEVIEQITYLFERTTDGDDAGLPEVLRGLGVPAD